MTNLAMILKRTGDRQRARLLCEDALRIQESAVGPDHPKLAQTLTSLASVHYALREYADAQPLYRRAHAIREKSLGANHLDSALALRNLALVAGQRNGPPVNIF